MESYRVFMLKHLPAVRALFVLVRFEVNFPHMFVKALSRSKLGGACRAFKAIWLRFDARTEHRVDIPKDHRIEKVG